jgi:flagellar biosynthesis/type III secretory pathway protein FliH
MRAKIKELQNNYENSGTALDRAFHGGALHAGLAIYSAAYDLTKEDLEEFKGLIALIEADACHIDTNSATSNETHHLTDKDRDIIHNLMPNPCPLKMDSLIKAIEDLNKKSHAAGYTTGYSEGHSEGMEDKANDNADDDYHTGYEEGIKEGKLKALPNGELAMDVEIKLKHEIAHYQDGCRVLTRKLKSALDNNRRLNKLVEAKGDQ